MEGRKEKERKYVKCMKHLIKKKKSRDREREKNDILGRKKRK